MSPQPSWQVLDVGCGTGTGLAGYLEAGCLVSGVDVSEAMLARAETRLEGRGDLHLIDGTSLPFPDAQFDLVTTSMVLHEVPEPDRVAFVTEMARVAKPQGRVLVADYRFGSQRGWKGPAIRTLTGVIERFSGHYSGYRTFRAAGGVPRVVESAGLDLERTKIVAGGNLAIYVILPGTSGR